MKLYKLLNGISFKVISGELSVDVTSLDDNSKKCTKGSLFFAIVGTKVNAEDYINEAVANGAIAVVVENEIDVMNYSDSVAVILVSSVRDAIGLIAKNYYCPTGYNFKIIGITGTNGKTTTSFIIGDALVKLKKNVCVVGTSGIFVNGICLRGEALTTPDPIELQSLFGFLNQIGVDYVVMEVSAHALDLDKTSGVVFDYAIFSNLTEDHLDYFGNMENYGKAKSKLLSNEKTRCAIINVSDHYGKHIASNRSAEFVTYGEADCQFQIKKTSNNSFKLKHNNKSINLKINIPGIYNIYNATSALIVLLKEGVTCSFLKSYLKKLRVIDGRYNEYKISGHGKVVLDFAHTPDGLEKLLTNVRENMAGKGSLISVFGCGGNRDRAKRPLMGEISARLADYTIISIDNPRFEDESIVMSNIEDGVKRISDNYEIIMPRASAIMRAIERSTDDDVIVVSGKGTEPYYEVNGKKEFYREDIVIDCIKKKIER